MDIPENKYLGVLCKRGHDWNDTGKSLRYKGKVCCECVKERGLKRNKEHPEYIANYRQNNKEKFIRANKKYRLNNKEYINKYRKINKSKINEKRKSYRNLRIRADTKYKLNSNIACLIRHSLKGNKNGHHWENIVGYTLKDLKKHLKKHFKKGMTWKNYGEWHIDHIIPIKVFNFDSFDQIDFKRCWALNNLQPLWAKENMIKREKIINAFQPSLKLEA
jgi:hypothetical protein